MSGPLMIQFWWWDGHITGSESSQQLKFEILFLLRLDLGLNWVTMLDEFIVYHHIVLKLHQQVLQFTLWWHIQQLVQKPWQHNSESVILIRQHRFATRVGRVFGEFALASWSTWRPGGSLEVCVWRKTFGMYHHKNRARKKVRRVNKHLRQTDS